MTFDELYRFDLKRGNHERPEDGLCALEAVAWFVGETHSDHPECVCPLIAHFIRSLNDRLEDRRQELVAYIPRLANSVGPRRVFHSRLRYLLREYLAVDGSQRLAARVDSRCANAHLPHFVSSFGLSVVCDAITLKRSASCSFEILDRLLSMGTGSEARTVNASRHAKEREDVLVG